MRNNTRKHDPPSRRNSRARSDSRLLLGINENTGRHILPAQPRINYIRAQRREVMKQHQFDRSPYAAPYFLFSLCEISARRSLFCISLVFQGD